MKLMIGHVGHATALLACGIETMSRPELGTHNVLEIHKLQEITIKQPTEI